MTYRILPVTVISNTKPEPCRKYWGQPQTCHTLKNHLLTLSILQIKLSFESLSPAPEKAYLMTLFHLHRLHSVK